MPPPAKPLSMEERIVFLEKQLQQKDQQLSKHAMDFNTVLILTRTKEVALAVNESKVLAKKRIPRPKGQAGKGKRGYKLSAAMRLSKNKPRYNRLMARRHIDAFIALL